MHAARGRTGQLRDFNLCWHGGVITLARVEIIPLVWAGARVDDRVGEEEVLQDIADHAAPSQAASRPRLQAKDLHPILVKGDLRRFQTPPADSLVRSGSQPLQPRWDEPAAASSIYF